MKASNFLKDGGSSRRKPLTFADGGSVIPSFITVRRALLVFPCGQATTKSREATDAQIVDRGDFRSTASRGSAPSCTTGDTSVAGKVTDEQGAILPASSIVLTNEESGVFREVTSSGEGTYCRLRSAARAATRSLAKLEGFRALERSGLVLGVGKTLTIDLSARGSVALEETVTVIGQSPLVDTRASEWAATSTQPSSVSCRR